MGAKKDKKSLSYTKRKSLYGYLFVSPWLLGVILFFAVPFGKSIYYSFNTLTMEAGVGFLTTFEGLRHFRYMFTEDAKFLPSLSEALVDIVYSVPLIVMFSLFIGVLLNQKMRGRTFYRAVFFLPVVVTSGVVLSILSSDINSSLIMSEQNYNSSTVLLNITVLTDLLNDLGLSAGFANALSSFVSQTINNTWYSGVQILLVIAGLQGISPALYEAARIEGASKWDEFWKITFPSLLPVLLLNIIYSIVDSFTNTDNPVMSVITESAFANFNYSYASAMSIVYSLTALVIIGLVYLLFGRKITYIEK